MRLLIEIAFSVVFSFFASCAFLIQSDYSEYVDSYENPERVAERTRQAEETVGLEK